MKSLLADGNPRLKIANMTKKIDFEDDRINDFLNEMDARNPGSKQALLDLLQKLNTSDFLKEELDKIKAKDKQDKK